MIVGLVTGKLNQDLETKITLWALKTVLKERGVMSVIVRRACEFNQVPQFLAEQFTVCDEKLCEDKESCLYEQISGYLLLAKAQKKPGTMKPCLDTEHPMLLLQQLKYHTIADMPQLQERVLLVDFSEWNEERERLVGEYCARRKIRKIAITARTEKEISLPGIAIEEMIPMHSPERLLGFLHLADCVLADCYMTAALAAIHQRDFVIVASGVSEENARTERLLALLGLSDHLWRGEGLGEVEDRIQDLVAFRSKLYLYRKRQMERLEKELKLDQAGLLVECPVKLPVSQCMACGACEAICPEGALSLKWNEKGFLRPVTDAAKCEECDRCVEVCIKKKQGQQVMHDMDETPAVYIAKKRTNHELTGAYSGLFSVLVHFIIAQRQGIVFGTTLNERQEPVMSWTEKEEEAEVFAQQRFVMPEKKEAFRKIKEELEKGRAVLFAGLPCECAGLRSFLRHRYTRLIICEFLCHGVSSGLLLKKYVDFIGKKRDGKITRVDFSCYPARSSSAAEKMKVSFDNGELFQKKHEDSEFYQLLDKQIVVDECCHYCTYSVRRRVGDITLGYLRELHGRKIPRGWKDCSILMAATQKKGHGLIELLADDLQLTATDYESVLRYQFRMNPPLKKERESILDHLEEEGLSRIFRRARKNKYFSSATKSDII